jgi:hypothetical protein
MLVEGFEKELRKEWEETVLLPGKEICGDPIFQLLYDLKADLYERLFPLGFQAGTLQEILNVFPIIHHALMDDGDLSIVLVHTKRPGFFCESRNIFVMSGHPSELLEDDIQYWAAYHCHDAVVTSIIAKSFILKALGQLHAILPRFERLRELNRTNVAMDYFRYFEETENLLEELVLGLR